MKRIDSIEEAGWKCTLREIGSNVIVFEEEERRFCFVLEMDKSCVGGKIQIYLSNEEGDKRATS